MRGIMKAAVWLGPEKMELQERNVPDVIPGSVLVKVNSCAVCGSDLRIYKSGNERVEAPRIIGHEISGEIVALGKGVTKFRVGDRVSTGADVPCGKCNHCISGRGNCCDINYAIGYQFDGGFAEYMLLDPLIVEFGPVQIFNRDLSFDAAALAEPLACCLNGYEVGMMRPGRSVVIFGAGPIGLLLAQLAPLQGATQVIIIDPAPERLANAAKLPMVTAAINPQITNPVEEVLRLTDGVGGQMIFTACPMPETHEQAVQMVAKRGVVNLFGGLPRSARPISILSNQIHYREAYLTGSHGSTPEQHRKALRLIEEGQIKTEVLISHKYGLNDIGTAFSTAASGQGIKVVVNPHSIS